MNRKTKRKPWKNKYINISEEKKCALTLEFSQYIVDHNSTFYKVSKEFNLSKTTVVRWFYKYLPELDLELYKQAKAIVDYHNKLTELKQKEMNRRVLEFAYFFLTHDLPLNKTVEIYPEKVQRTKIGEYMYTRLYNLDDTPDKILYRLVMKQMAKYDSHSCASSKSKQSFAKIEEEISLKEKLDVSKNSRDIEKKILYAAKQILLGKSISEVSSEMQVKEKDIKDAFSEVLPNINMSMYRMVCSKLNLKDNQSDIKKIMLK